MLDALGNVHFGDKTSPARVGAGGFVDGQSQTLNGLTRTCHTDTFGGYVKRPGDTEWQQLLTEERLGSFTTDGEVNVHYDGQGMYALAVAPSDGTIGYGSVYGKIFATNDNWESFYACPLTAQKALANNTIMREYHDALVIDPQNPLVAVIGFMDDSGIYYTLDGFVTSPTKITGIADPAPTAGRDTPLIAACDPTSAVVGGIKQKWAIASNGTGIYQSTGGPDGPYTLLNSAGMPTKASHLFYDDWGDLWVCTNTNGKIKKYAAGAWAAEDMPDNTWLSLVVNPNNRLQKVAFTPSNFYTFTDETGAWLNEQFTNTYGGHMNYTNSPNGPRWLNQDAPQLYPSHYLWSRVEDSDHILMSHGAGTCYAPMRGIENFQWVDDSRGIEQLIANAILYNNGRWFLACWDIGWFQMEDLDVFPTHVNGGLACWDSDAAGDTVIIGMGWTWVRLYITDDNGDNFRYVEHPDGADAKGCSVAVGNANDMIWIPFYHKRAVASDDGGLSWDPIDLGGLLPASGISQGWAYNEWFFKKIAVASKETPGKWWLYNYGADGIELATQGLWCSETGPKGPYTRIFTGQFDTNGAVLGFGQWVYNTQIKEIPGHADELLIAPGITLTVPLCRSLNGGGSWARVSTLIDGVSHEVMGCGPLGFGKNIDGAAYPAIRYFATVNDQFGLFETLDNFATSTFIRFNFDGWLTGGGIKDICGNMDVFGEWVYAFASCGWKQDVYRDFAK